MYGRSRKGTRSYRGSASRNYRKPYSRMLKTAPYTGRRGTYKTGLKFATVGYTRDVEKKYRDMALIASRIHTRGTGASGAVAVDNGMMFSSNEWTGYDFDVNTAASGNFSNDLLKGVAQGTTADRRIGNRIRGRWIKGAYTLGSVKIAGPSSGATNGDMNGEALGTAANATTVWQYMRTSWRVVIVKDLQVNSVDAKISWYDVFGALDNSRGQIGGIHSELNISNMGRFKILSDRSFKTDGVNPQETITFWIQGKDIGNVRYNGPDTNALTDKGIYIIWAAYVSGVTAPIFGVEGSTEGMVPPTFTMHSRLAFTDE